MLDELWNRGEHIKSGIESERKRKLHFGGQVWILPSATVTNAVQVKMLCSERTAQGPAGHPCDSGAVDRREEGSWGAVG